MGVFGTGTGPKIEALINSVWTDITSRVRGGAAVSITRGRANEQARTAAQACNLTLENPDGYFSTRDPSSVNYGVIGRNTQLRVSAGTGDYYLKVPWSDVGTFDNIVTASKASLNIVGDLDVRMEVWPHTWRPGRDTILMSKYSGAGNQRSWAFYVNQTGSIVLVWSTDGTTGTRTFATSTAFVPSTAGRIGIRATLQVNNGAAGNTVTFYTSTSITGTWTQLGATIVTAGVTSIFSSTSRLVVGGGDDTPGIFVNGIAGGGRIYKAEVYNGIAGTRVANMDATSRSLGDTTWSDGLASPNTWTIAGTLARITSDRLRFWGELSSLPKRWDPTGGDVYIPAVASGMIRRLTQGASPLRSPMFRNFTQYSPYGYWTFEDGSEATSAASAVSGGLAAVTTAVSFSSATTLPGAEQTLAFTGTTGQIVGVPNTVVTTGTQSFVFYTKLSSLPATSKVLCWLAMSGTARRVEVSVSATVWTIQFFDSTGTSLGSSTTAISTINPTNQWIGYNLLLQTSGSDMTYSVRWDVVGTGYGGGIGPTTITSATVGRFTNVTLSAINDSAFNDAQFGHVFMSTQNLDLSTDAFRQASGAYLGETAIARMRRLCTEEGVTLEVTGITADSETVGYQSVATFMDLIYECWDADGGAGGEARDRLALTYRTRVDLERRTDVSLSYLSSHLSQVPEPTDDDQGIVNDVTVSRPSGASARSIITSGATSISSPPIGIGRYDTAVTLNIGSDARLPSVAGWVALVGSWDQDRYPNLAVALHRAPLTASTSLSGQVMALDLGDTAALTGLPSWLPPDSVYEIVQGYQETLNKFTWDVVFNCTPAGPYQAVPILVSDDYPVTLDANGHTIGGSMTTTATSVTIVTPTGSQRWVDSATYASSFPTNIIIAGEVMTLTAVTGTSSPQTATVTRSVNGVVKAHLSGETVQLANPYYVAR